MKAVVKNMNTTVFFATITRMFSKKAGYKRMGRFWGRG
jgi:hypothetical protein